MPTVNEDRLKLYGGLLVMPPIMAKSLAAIQPIAVPSPFTPASLSGLALWLDATAITGLVDADPVGTWSDLSGNGNDATQATAAKKPTYKTNIQNGKPVVRFDGADDYLQTATIGALAQPNTVCIVGALGVGDFLLDGGVGGTARHVLLDSGGFVSWSAGTVVSSTVATPIALSVLTATFNGASSILRRNGAQIKAGNIGAQSCDGWTIGGRFNGATVLGGDIAEVVFCSGLLSDALITQVENYYNSKWAIY